MSKLTITNSAKVKPIAINVTLKNEDYDNCSASILEFEVIGNVTNYPAKLQYEGSPSGTRVTFFKTGVGSGSFKELVSGEEFYGDVQVADGNVAFTEIDLLLTNTGTTKFRFEILSSNAARNPINNNMVLLQCEGIEGDTNVQTYASGEIFINDTTEGLYLTNSRNMYY